MRLNNKGFFGLWAALAAIFVGAQAISVAHFAKYGDAPHDHNGVICAISVAANGGEKAIAAAVFVVLGTFALWRIAPAPAPKPIRIATRRLPRNRAPPAC